MYMYLAWTYLYYTGAWPWSTHLWAPIEGRNADQKFSEKTELPGSDNDDEMVLNRSPRSSSWWIHELFRNTFCDWAQSWQQLFRTRSCCCSGFQHWRLERWPAQHRAVQHPWKSDWRRWCEELSTSVSTTYDGTSPNKKFHSLSYMFTYVLTFWIFGAREIQDS